MKMLKFIFAFFLFTALVSCQVPMMEPFAVIDFRSEIPVSVDVDSIDVVDQTTRYTELPHLETRIPIVPSYALSKALQNRFKATGNQSGNTISFIIQKADLIQKFQKTERWYQWNNTEYLLDYQIDVVYNQNGINKETQQIAGWEKQALPKRSSLADKETAWKIMIDSMIQKVADKIEADMPPTLKE